jgi:endogenous inhibitor of DNA gyrase (YacG/DUF329 family)
MTVPCPACGQTLNILPEDWGTEVKHNCPRCRQRFWIGEFGYVYKGRRIGTEAFESGS